jgi:predicted DNA-binding protein with PD1-like motif
MRHVVQPGRAVPERIQWAEARGRAFSFALQEGLPLLETVRRGFAAEGFASGTLSMTGGALGPLAYVMPALPRTRGHAAYYSDIFRPAGITQLKSATMTFGERDGAPFFHCHSFWTEADGRPGGGHILPEEAIVAATSDVTAFGLDGGGFIAEHDVETNFKLFVPTAASPTGRTGTRRAFVLRLRPNQDFAHALESFCHEHAIKQAKVHGGVGSIIGARFANGRIVEPFATEMAVLAGRVVSVADGLAAELDVALVDHGGGLSQGRLARGDNPILMTMELVLEVIDDA